MSVTKSAREQLRQKHRLPDPTWSIPSVEGPAFRLASVEELLLDDRSNGTIKRVELPPAAARNREEERDG